MLTPTDLKQIKGLIDDSEGRLQKKLTAKIDDNEKKLTAKINESADQVRLEIGDVLTEKILPMFENLATKDDIERLERKIDRATDKNIEQDFRLDNIESTPTIAHELKVKSKIKHT